MSIGLPGKKLLGCGLPLSSVREDRFPKVLWEGHSLTQDRHNPWRVTLNFLVLGTQVAVCLRSFIRSHGEEPGASMSEY